MLVDRTDPAAVTTLSAQPVLLGDLFGWFTPGSSGRGVLLCGTFGIEQLNAYRAWGRLAARIAGAGCPTLRFDYAGEGDSGEHAGPDRVTEALAAIDRGIRFLRAEAGAEEIVLVGLRLGATLAARAAEAGGVDRLVLLAPFASGQAYLREMTLQARLIDRLPDGTPLPQEPGALSVGGFQLDPATIAALGALDLATTARAPAPEILLLGPKTAALADRYRTLGAAVTTGAFPELAPLVSDPLFAPYPERTFEAVCAFAAAGATPSPAPCRRPAPAGTLAGTGWRESVQAFGSGLVGVLCRPETRQPGTPTVIVVNSGLNARSGYGRQTTALARRLAATGIASLRFDPRGIGDSADRDDDRSPFYAPDAVTDVRAALDHLAEVQDGPVVILGTCSGAYLAFNALCADERLRAAVLVNLYCFDLKPGTDIETMVRDTFRHGQGYLARARQRGSWQRILSGEIRLAQVAGAIRRDGSALLGRCIARLSRLVLVGESTGRRVARLRRRGGRIAMVYSADDPGLATLRAHLGASTRVGRRLGYPVALLDGADHNLSRPADHDRLLTIVQEVAHDAARADRAGAAPARLRALPAREPNGLLLRPSETLP